LYAFFARTVSENLPILVVDLLRFLLVSHVPVSTQSFFFFLLLFPSLSFPLDFEFVASFGKRISAALLLWFCFLFAVAALHAGVASAAVVSSSGIIALFRLVAACS
jgi:hypothetical protein